MMENNRMDKVVSLAKRRGFVYPSSEIYGGLANAWDYGPMGVELKNNIKKLWWDRFVHRRDDIVGLDAALIMNPQVWEASGHLKEFSDPLVECKKCHHRFRGDTLLEEFFGNNPGVMHQLPIDVNRDFGSFDIQCPNCKENLRNQKSKQFNLMLKTFLGPAEEKANEVYFRPETAQAMFVDFKTVLDTTRVQLPFGIAQIGKAFRNEITPGNFIFRTREFEQMEIEYFIPAPTRDDDWQEPFEYWRLEMHGWIEALGIDGAHVHELEVPDGERAHYSKRTIDFEYDFPFGRKELYALSYRGDFDLKNHEKVSGKNLQYKDPQTGEEFFPHVIEPTWGVDRSVLAVLCDAYAEDGDRVFLKLKPELAPYKAAVFPLLRNKPELTKLAREIFTDLQREFYVSWDERGNIGKRYYAQDEIGTPYCITVDFDSLEKNDVTVRYRDTAQQERVPIKKIKDILSHEAGR